MATAPQRRRSPRFSAPGVKAFMRGASVREGETNLPVTRAEDDELQRKHSHDVIYE